MSAPRTQTEPTRSAAADESLPAPSVRHVPAGQGIPLWVPEEPPPHLVDGDGPPMSKYTFIATADTTAGVHPARMLRIYTPGGMERFFIDISRPAKPGESAPQLTTEDVRRAEEGAARHYGPPPQA